jgi:hypothetical protein
MAKLTEFVTPTGAHGNLMKPMSLLPMITGGVVFLGVLAVAAKIFGMGKALLPGPARSWLGSGTPFVRDNDNAKPAPTAPAIRIYN